MPAIDFVRTLFDRFTRRARVPRRDEFACGDCVMNERCGQPPSEDCVARAAQIATGRGRRRPLVNLDASY
jgi:hypothetical protein